MSDVSELVGHCREPLSMSKFLRKDHLLARANEDRALAADALETLAGENERLCALVSESEKQRYAACGELALKLEAAESRLAKLAPVVEAARGIKRAEDAKDQGEWVKCHDAMYRALAAMDAAHD